MVKRHGKPDDKFITRIDGYCFTLIKIDPDIRPGRVWYIGHGSWRYVIMRAGGNADYQRQ
jgi:hypothetical protein